MTVEIEEGPVIVQSLMLYKLCLPSLRNRERILLSIGFGAVRSNCVRS